MMLLSRPPSAFAICCSPAAAQSGVFDAGVVAAARLLLALGVAAARRFATLLGVAGGARFMNAAAVVRSAMVLRRAVVVPVIAVEALDLALKAVSRSAVQKVVRAKLPLDKPSSRNGIVLRRYGKPPPDRILSISSLCAEVWDFRSKGERGRGLCREWSGGK